MLIVTLLPLLQVLTGSFDIVIVFVQLLLFFLFESKLVYFVWCISSLLLNEMFAFTQLICRNSLRVAKEKNIQYIAFPAISCGVFGQVHFKKSPCHYEVFNLHI